MAGGPRRRDADASACRRQRRPAPLLLALQVHPLVAQSWQSRLAPRAVIAANDGYLPGRVNFAVRGGRGDLRRLLREALPDLGGEFAHGHDRATGGSIAPGDFDRLLEALGFGA